MRKSLLLSTLFLAALATGRSYAIMITSPTTAGGQNWGLGTYQFITWTGATGSGNVKIELSLNGGTTWLAPPIASSVPSSGGSGSFFWRVESPAAATTTAKIRVSDLSSSAKSASGNFTISNSFRPGAITVNPSGDGSYTIDLVVSAVSPDDPNGANPDGGRHAFKYTYTIKNNNTSTSFPKSYLGYFHLPNCDQRFCAPPARLGTGTVNTNFVPNTWSAGTSDIYWTANNSQNDGVGPGALPAQPKSTQIFCVYTNQVQVASKVSIDVLHKQTSGSQPSTATATFDYWAPGCPNENPELPEGCEHRFHMAQVYPVAVSAGGTIPGNDLDIENLSCWSGATPIPIVGTGICKTERLALPGFLCLKTDEDGLLDVNAFVTTGKNGCGTNPLVQDWSLTKVAAPAPKCPEIFHGYTITQVKDRIRTAWPLAYTTPGTTFTLSLTGCNRNSSGDCVSKYQEKWVWEVVANAETFCHLIDLFHTNTLSVLEVPSIVGEDTYKALKQCAEDLLAAFPPGTDPKDLDLDAVKTAIENCEAIIMCNTLFWDHLAKPQTMTYPYYQAYPKRQLPPNPAILDTEGNVDTCPDENGKPMGGTIGIIDTHENPAACKLLADLDYIAVKAGLRDEGQSP